MKLTDSLRALFAPATTKPPTGAAAAGLLTHQALDLTDIIGILQVLPDPDELLRQSGLSRAKLSTLLYDPEIGGAIETRRDAVIATPHRLDAGDAQETEPVQWVEEEICDHIDPALRGAWSAVPYGYSVMEVVYGRRPNGRLGIDWVGEKPLQWFGPQHNGSVLYTPAQGGTPAPIDLDYKFIFTARNATYHQPQGEALLSRAYWLWWFLQAARKGNAKFLDRFHEPIITGAVGNPGALVDAMQKIGIDAVVAVQKGDDVKAMLAGFAGEYPKWIDILERGVQKLILGQTGTTDVKGGGSYAAAKVQDGVRDDKLQADLRLVRRAGQALVDRLWALNRFPGDAPDFCLGEENNLEMDRATRDATLANAGIATFSKSYLTSAYGFEETDLEEAAPVPPGLQQPAQPAAGPQPNDQQQQGDQQQQDPATDPPTDGAPPPAKMAASLPAPRFTPAQQAVEGLVATAMQEVTLGIPVAELRAAIQGAADPADLEARLAVLIASRDKAQMADALSRALFAAQVLGYVASDKGRS